MGYDMHWRNVPESETIAVSAARELWDQAINARDNIPQHEKGVPDHDWLERNGMNWDDPRAWTGRSDRYHAAQAEVSRASGVIDGAEKSYFRFNIWGMQRARDIMYTTGMAFEDELHPPFPSPEDCGITWDMYHAVEYPDDSDYEEARIAMTPGQREQAVRMKAEHDAVLASHTQEVPGIPLHKFSSNDGWIVVPAECDAAVALWKAYLTETGEDATRDYVENSFGGRGYARWLMWVEFIRSASRYGGFEVWLCMKSEKTVIAERGHQTGLTQCSCGIRTTS